MKKPFFLALTGKLLALAVCAAPAPALASSDTASEGLQPVQSKVLDQVLIAPGADLSAFGQVYLAPPEIEFRKNWLRDQNRRQGVRLRDEDVARLREDLASLVHEVFTEELEKAGFTVVDEAAPGVLTVHPDIVELDIIAPDLGSASAGRTFQYSQSAGEMTLRLTAEDDGTPLLEVRDRKRDVRELWFEWRTRVSNRADAKRWLRSWAGAVSQGLANSDWNGTR